MVSVINNKGFTLVELSIVIVIIGLIVAGIVGGQSLVKQAKLRSILTDTDKYIVSINTYKLEYDALPGDHSVAHSFFGNACDTVASRCNGDGDKRILYDNQGGGISVDNEGLRISQHLSLAGLTAGSFNGTASVSAQCDPGITHHKVYNNAGIAAGGLSNPIFDQIYMGNPVPNTTCWGAFLKPSELYGLDIKIDDGKPDSGQIHIMSQWNVLINGHNAVGNCFVGTEYDIANDNIACHMRRNLSL